MMETWFLNHVLGLSLSVLLLGLPGTPVINGPGPAATGMYHPAATAGPGLTENGETSTPHSSESLSPSQRSLLLTHPAGSHSAPAANLDTEQTQTFTETSSGSLETTSLSTEPLSSPIIATTEASGSGTGISGIRSISSSSSISTSRSGSSNTGISSTSNTGISSSSSSGTSSSSSGIGGGSSSSISGTSRSGTSNSGISIISTISTGPSSRGSSGGTSSSSSVIGSSISTGTSGSGIGTSSSGISSSISTGTSSSGIGSSISTSSHTSSGTSSSGISDTSSSGISDTSSSGISDTSSSGTSSSGGTSSHTSSGTSSSGISDTSSSGTSSSGISDTSSSGTSSSSHTSSGTSSHTSGGTSSSGISGTSSSGTSSSSHTSSSGTSSSGTSSSGTSSSGTSSSGTSSSSSHTSSSGTSSTSSSGISGTSSSGTSSSSSHTSSSGTSSSSSHTSSSGTSSSSHTSSSGTSSSGTSSSGTSSSGTSSSSSHTSSSGTSSTSSSGISGTSSSGTSSSSSHTSSSGTSSSSSHTSSSGTSSSGTSSSGTSSSGTSSSGTSSRGTSSTSSSGIGSSSSTSSSGTSSSSSSGIGSSSGTSSSGTSSSGTSSDTSSSSGIGSSGSSISSGDWKEFVITDQVPGVSHTVSWEARSLKFTEETILPQDSPESTLWLGDATELSSQTAVQTDSMYTSTTSRVGERTLLSVTSSTSNSTSFAFTEESNPDQPLSAWGIPARTTGTEDYTQSAPSTRTGSGETTDQHMTQSFKTMFPDGGDRGVSEGIPISTGPPNATQHQHTTAAEETSESTPPLRVTDFSTDQSESMSSAPTVTSAAGGPTSITGTDVEFGSNAGASTESSTAGHSSSTLNQEGTERLTYQTREDNRDLGLSTAPPTISSNTTGSPQTETPELATELFLTTTPVPVTDRSQITREYTLKATASTTTTTATAPTLPVTSSSTFSSTASTSVSEMQTDTAFPFTIPTTTASTVALQTPAITPTYLAPPEQTNGPSTRTANPTDFPSLHVETSTGSTTVSTSRSQYVTTTYQHSSPTRNTEALHTTGKQAVRGTTEQVLTASPTDMQSTKAPPPVPRNPCVSNPCMNGGKCVSYKEHQYICHCQQAWTGPNCNQDMDECEKDPCPLGSRCVNTRGSFSCECPLGFDLENGRTCSRAKTFLGTFSVNKLPHDPVVFRSATIHEIYREIIQLLNASLSAFQGYSRSTLSKKEEDGVRILAVNMFSISTDVTSAEVFNSIKMSLSNCSSSLSHCRMVLQHQLAYEVESLCVAQKTQCDTERSTCTDSNGTAHCQCFLGYYKHNPDDLSCLECGDGYKLENGTCVPCMFGFGGFNCGNFYKLIAVVVSPAGGALLLILIIALIVTCCKKDKNDINKIIFKSGDLQMSPYADFPKNNRISMEWGRETIEMQENGSTKNLLQMTDIYYSPALRNSDLERNGLYPFTGLPGSRHSCIYPAQWNPSFISDDSRRRDYF